MGFVLRGNYVGLVVSIAQLKGRCGNIEGISVCFGISAMNVLKYVQIYLVPKPAFNHECRIPFVNLLTSILHQMSRGPSTVRL